MAANRNDPSTIGVRSATALRRIYAQAARSMITRPGVKRNSIHRRYTNTVRNGGNPLNSTAL